MSRQLAFRISSVCIVHYTLFTMQHTTQAHAPQRVVGLVISIADQEHRHSHSWWRFPAMLLVFFTGLNEVLFSALMSLAFTALTKQVYPLSSISRGKNRGDNTSHPDFDRRSAFFPMGPHTSHRFGVGRYGLQNIEATSPTHLPHRSL
ncbi:hypothetical protein BXZ70DRAFT_646488 [Cristinia sonorae]|uniref:Uncharacterized protein n=1 Tax=Cristinia sonorae TaxID=1940300 RepID=A0A8K0UF05_9AGAR|nr:hypothetical protein BXZ70DRAFT_646488 [Cristinia sonorae]